MKKLGVIGGLGPMATVYFMQLLTEMMDAKTDQEHMEILLHSKPEIPDRTEFILGNSEKNPVPQLIEIGNELKKSGAEVLAVPCITAHCFHRMLENSVGMPVINAIEETSLHLKENGIQKVGIMATDGTIKCKLLQSSLEDYGMQVFLPKEAEQKQVMHLIYKDVKAGQQVEIERFKQVAEHLFSEEAQVILLGCTELSLIKRDFSIGAGFLDIMEVLAKKSVETCGKLKAEYKQLITKD